MRAAALNHHDMWTLRGVGVTEDDLPVVLGTDAAGVTADGREVVVHAVLGRLCLLRVTGDTAHLTAARSRLVAAFAHLPLDARKNAWARSPMARMAAR